LVVVGDVSHQEDLANILNCSISSLPLKFSRLPLGASFKLKAIWDVIVEKMEKKKKRLASWKKINLSWGGRLTLIKTMLSILLTYFLSFFPLPIGIARRLECLQRDFLWDGP
jgi:hypothetical protein